MNDNILLVTKDATVKEYLPIYGNQYWKGKTPNIDELAAQGTVFDKYYTAAPSTVMAFRSMMYGKWPHETPYADYIPMDIKESESDFFNVAKLLGYEGHLIWDETWVRMVLRYGNCFGSNCQIHNVVGLNQPVGPHTNHKEFLKDDDELLIKTINTLETTVREIVETGKKIVMWIHLPHVISGRTGYGGDIDAFDMCIGMLRKYFDDKHIYISADHGNMDGYHGRYSYGFDVYTPAIEIPLITPRIDNLERCTFNVSNVDIKRIIFEGLIPQRDVIYSDCAYYAQPHRKIAILKGDFAYIYNKTDRSEELYDLIYDRFERCNMIKDTFFDKDRKLTTVTREVYFTPRWGEAEIMREEMRNEFGKIWKTASLPREIRGRMLAKAKIVFVVLRKLILGR